MSQAALGFRPHTGWTTAVAVAAGRARPTVVERRRVELSSPTVPWQVYHAARELGPDAAAELVSRAREAAREAAVAGVGDLVAAFRERGLEAVGAGVPTSRSRVPATLRQVLAELGRALGPPWRQDEKQATLAAWLALASSRR